MLPHTRQKKLGRMILKVLKALGEVLATLVMVAAIGLLAFMLLGPRFGWYTHPVLTGSMEPALPVGGVIVTRPIPVGAVKVGDIVTLLEGENLVTHRVVEVSLSQTDEQLLFKTKGDANQEPDPGPFAIQGDQVALTVFYIPYVGRWAQAVSRIAVLPILGAIFGTIMVVILGSEVWKGIREVKQKRREDRKTSAEKVLAATQAEGGVQDNGSA